MKKFILILILLFLLTSCGKQNTPIEGGYLYNTEINNKLEDLLEKYSFVKGVDGGIDLCGISEDIKNSYLKLKDGDNYKKWYTIYKTNCASYKEF